MTAVRREVYRYGLPGNAGKRRVAGTRRHHNMTRWRRKASGNGERHLFNSSCRRRSSGLSTVSIALMVGLMRGKRPYKSISCAASHHICIFRSDEKSVILITHIQCRLQGKNFLEPSIALT